MLLLQNIIFFKHNKKISKKAMNNNFNEKLEILRKVINESKTYDDKLKKWADFTVNYCDNVARTTIDRSFYAFQSEPKESPEILLLGLNPKGKDNYESIFQNSINGWGLNSWGKMIPEVFVHQNPWYIGGTQASIEKEWNILKKMNKTIHVNQIGRASCRETV